MRGAAICDGAHFHLLDHLAPLCYYLDIPLITDHPLSHQLALTYYPQITSLLIEEDYLAFLAEHYDFLLTSSRFTAEELSSLLHSIHEKKLSFFFVPHGNSDKNLDIFKNQTHTFVYGSQMKERLHNFPLKILPMGNLRLKFYEENRPFYNSFYPKKGLTLLYAPTWNDKEKLTSFFKSYKELLETLPSHVHLIIKLHPLLEKYYPSPCHYLLGQGELRDNLTVLHEFPPIYPILSQADYYLGDYSSIGYDFLSFDRPLFLIGEPSPLHSCSTLLTRPFFETLETHKDTLSSSRQKTYALTFDPAASPSLIKEAINSYF